MNFFLLVNSSLFSISFQANYNSSLCANVITRLGYGSAEFLILTGTVDANRPFMIHSNGSDGQDAFALSMSFLYLDIREIRSFAVIRDNRVIRNLVNFEWFKTNFICQDHPEECV